MFEAFSPFIAWHMPRSNIEDVVDSTSVLKQDFNHYRLLVSSVTMSSLIIECCRLLYAPSSPDPGSSPNTEASLPMPCLRKQLQAHVAAKAAWDSTHVAETMLAEANSNATAARLDAAHARAGEAEARANVELSFSSNPCCLC